MSIGIILLLFFVGFPLMGRFTSFLSNIRSSVNSGDDKIPPAPPRFNTFADHTNKKSFDIGGKSESGATIELMFNGSKKENIANKNGEFSFNLDLKEGENKFSAIAIDTAENKSQETDIFSITYDNKAPKLELERPEDGSNLFGTAQRQITIEGATDPEAAVT